MTDPMPRYFFHLEGSELIEDKRGHVLRDDRGDNSRPGAAARQYLACHCDQRMGSRHCGNSRAFDGRELGRFRLFDSAGPSRLRNPFSHGSHMLEYFAIVSVFALACGAVLVFGAAPLAILLRKESPRPRGLEADVRSEAPCS